MEVRNDFVGLVVQPNRLAENVFGAAKPILPERKVEHDHPRRAHGVFFGREEPAEHGLDAQDLEIAVGDLADAEPYGFLRARLRCGPRPKAALICFRNHS